MHPEVVAILQKVNTTADFGYVEFSDINAINSMGDNALHCVIVWGDYEAAKTLIAHGINLNQKGERGYTPLHQACEFGHKDIARLLLENGADPFARTDGEIPFAIAKFAGHEDICAVIKEFAKDRQSPRRAAHDQHLEKLSDFIKKTEDWIKRNCDKKNPI